MSKEKHAHTNHVPKIDIVVPWVDSSDPAWRKVKSQYLADGMSDDSDARYRDWDLFQYWFRAIEANAPWVHKVYLITFGHLPSWLNTEHPKLVIVKHEDYIPAEYLPTFSSHTIELNLHRIPGLAEHFLYFNDDVYLAQPTKATDFFVKGLPVDRAVLGMIKNTDSANFMPYIMLNMLGLINHHFDKRSIQRKSLSKWFSLRYGKDLLYNVYLSPWGHFTGFRNAHSCSAFCKSTLREAWELWGEVLHQTCLHKFRSREDVNQYIFRYLQFCEGRFVPGRANSAYYTNRGAQSRKQIEAALQNTKYQVVCINDDPMGFDFEEEREAMVRLLQKKFPQKSQYEQ